MQKYSYIQITKIKIKIKIKTPNIVGKNNIYSMKWKKGSLKSGTK